LVAFRTRDSEGVGILNGDGDGVVDVGSRLGYSDLSQLVRDGRLADCADLAGEVPDHAVADIVFDPVIRTPAHIFCVGANYSEHRREVADSGIPRAPTEHPTIFTRFPETIVGHQRDLVKPHGTDSFDFEGELAAIIGVGGRRIPRDEALRHVAGYSCFNDGSIREWQFHTSQVQPGKNFIRTGSLGPWLVTADEIADPHHLDIQTRLNKVVVQQSNTSQMIFDIPTIIAYVSTLVPLEPGDVIATGTPSGVGFTRNPPLFMNPGDTCEITVEGIGTLRNTVVSEHLGRPDGVG
jgi:2-keto-4-pentenoate hydratase/2-oxohepta-3-ene-1,7-dioic acid hydratase in catechol pathway